MDFHTICDATPPVSYLPNLIPHHSGICQISTLLAVKRVFKNWPKVENYFTKESLGSEERLIPLK